MQLNANNMGFVAQGINCANWCIKHGAPLLVYWFGVFFQYEKPF
jgi:hypothetical protein